MSRPTFVPTISLGNLLTIMAALGSLISVYVSLNGRVAALETIQAATSAAVLQADARTREDASETRSGLHRLEDKITALLIQGYRPRSETAP